MPMLKSIGGHGSTVKIKWYLQKKERSLAFDSLNLGYAPSVDWAQQMDETRAFYGNDRAWKGREARTFEHFIISPDPRDDIDLDTLRKLAVTWAKQKFGSGFEAGECGCFQVAIEYHDDNERGIPHAHVVVNNTNFENGKRLQLGNADATALGRDLQAIAKGLGLTHFSDSVIRDGEALFQTRSARRQSHQAEYKTKKEKEVEAKGQGTWKNDLRDYIAIAAQLADDIEGIRGELRKFGVESEEKKGDLLFFHPDGGAKKVYGARLGKDYTIRGIESQMKLAYYKRLAEEDRAEDSIYDRLSDVQVVHTKGKDVPLSDIAKAFGCITEYKLQTLAEAKQELSFAKIRAARHEATDGFDEEEAGALREEVTRLARAVKAIEGLGLLPDNEKKAYTKPKDWMAVEAQRKWEGKSGKKAPLSLKVKRGWRLTKDEYASLSKKQRSVFLANRKAATAGKPVPEGGGGKDEARDSGTARNHVKEAAPDRGKAH